MHKGVFIMNKGKYILILIIAYTIGIFENDCTFAVVMSLFLLPAIFERKEKRNAKKIN